MRLVRATFDVRATERGWTVSVAMPGLPERPAREVQRVGDVPRPAPGSHFDTEDPSARVTEALERLMLRAPEGDDVKEFGRYLFGALVQPDWAAMVQAAADDGIELAMSWPAEEASLHRLPWELMHGPDGPEDSQGFLAGSRARPVTITRVVSGAATELDELPATLRVLFVIGTDRSEAAIRSGREYLTLVQRLHAQGVSLCSRVLVQATRTSLQDELARWRPTVLHFIGHGQLVGSELKLALTSEDEPGRSDPIDAEQLLNLLRDPARPMPQVVVLNACNTSGVPFGQQAAPMAARIVAGGVPVVVGMSGQVADSACRLFTRRFYEALLKGESVVAASAEGRRAGLRGSDPCHTVDWAFPTLFLSERASPEVRLAITGRDVAARLHELATAYRKDNNPRFFCDRFEIVEDAYHRLMAGPSGPSLLGVRATDGASGRPDARFGKTRLLQEFAARAVTDGHVPCQLGFDGGDDPPGTTAGLGLALAAAILDARKQLKAQEFDISTTPVLQIHQLLEALASLPYNAEPATSFIAAVTRRRALEQAIAAAPPPVARDDLATALREDLAALTADARRFLPEARVLVLIDEAHRFDSAVGDLIALLTPYGLGTRADPVPVVFTFSAAQNTQYASAVEALGEFLESGRMYVEKLDLGPLPDPREDPVPYQQFLLYGTDRPLVFSRRARAENVEPMFYELLAGRVQGIPSTLRLWNDGVKGIIDSFLRLSYLEPADDEELLAELRQQ